MQQESITHLLSLDARIVVIAGAGGGGIGTTIARLVAAAGATVIAVDRSADSLATHIEPLIAQGLPIRTLVADVLSDEGAAAVLDFARSTPGNLHGLVTVVGGTNPFWGPATRTPRAVWKDMLSVNLDSMFFMTSAVAAELKAQNRPGSLVAISSTSGLTANPFQIGYGAAKAAILSVVKTMALELAADGIRVNCVAPGAISTPAAAKTVSYDLEARNRRAIPMARQGRPEDIAAAVLFLLCDMSSYITGQCITVDGGMNLKWAVIDEDNCPVYLKNRTFLQEP